MILFVVIFEGIFTINIDFTILYEKEVEKTVKETYRIYLEQLVKSINRITEPKKIAFNLNHIYGHSEYEHIKQFDELSRYAGSENITKRILALNETDVTNYILAISTGSDDDVRKYQIIEPCRINYILNLESDENFDRDLLTNLLYGILDVFTKLFGFSVPNLLDMNNQEIKDNFINNVMRSDLEDKLRKCIRNNIDDKKDFKSSLKESDDFVGKFDKLFSLLESNKEKLKSTETPDDLNLNNNEQRSNEQRSNEQRSNEQRSNEKDSKKLIESKFKKQPDLPSDLNRVLKNILSGIENLEHEVNDLKSKERERNGSDHFRRRFRDHSNSNRSYGDYKNEEVGIYSKNKGPKELLPFAFKKSETDIKDLKPINKD